MERKTRRCIDHCSFYPTDILRCKSLIHIISRGISSCYFGLSVNTLWGPGSQRKIKCLNFHFLSVSWGEQKASRQSHLIFGGHPIFKKFHQKVKNVFSWGTLLLCLWKQKQQVSTQVLGNIEKWKSQWGLCLPWGAFARVTNSFGTKKT